MNGGVQVLSNAIWGGVLENVTLQGRGGGFEVRVTQHCILYLNKNNNSGTLFVCAPDVSNESVWVAGNPVDRGAVTLIESFAYIPTYLNYGLFYFKFFVKNTILFWVKSFISVRFLFLIALSKVKINMLIYFKSLLVKKAKIGECTRRTMVDEAENVCKDRAKSGKRRN